MTSLPREHDKRVAGFRAFVERAVPEGATVLVVSKGDDELLSLELRQAWHFPQRSDGVYAGYHPADSAVAIAHLETLKSKGADILAFPWSSLWWLDHYPEFTRHLETQHQELARDDEAGVLFALSDAARSWVQAASDGASGAEGNGGEASQQARLPTDAAAADEQNARGSPTVERSQAPSRRLELALDDSVMDDLRGIFDASFYGERIGLEFSSPDDALVHYLETGYRDEVDPHPLFDTRWYLSRNPAVRLTGANPLVHFVTLGTAGELDPNPYFDASYYYAHQPNLRERGGNALLHYLQDPSARETAIPNPLFRDRYYLRTYPDVGRDARSPLEHYLLTGQDEGRAGSHVHHHMVTQVRLRSAALSRGAWRKGTILFFSQHAFPSGQVSLAEVAEHIGVSHHVGSLVVAYRGGRIEMASQESRPHLVLEDYELACEVFRPSALRFLALSLTLPRPLFAVSDVEEVLEPLYARGVGVYSLLPDAHSLPQNETLHRTFANSRRVLVPSSGAFHAAGERLGRYPTNVARRRRIAEAAARNLTEAPDDNGEESSGGGFARELVELAQEDFNVDLLGPRMTTDRASAPRKVLIPCWDWSVSGVNASLEAVGMELIERGWDIEILFTRDQDTVAATAQEDKHLPQLPYRFLRRDKPGLMGMWEALIGELEASAPCIVFTVYDFLANSVVPALTDNVGVVMWVQADDGDYYEQVYRLGRYCDAVVCVSEQIRDKVSELNPLIGERAHVIPNSSVRRREVARRRPRRGKRMSIVYCGRLVQYQKRVLDFVPLAQALDATGTPYEISLIGSFSPQEATRETFAALARERLEDGRIRLRGRMTRAEILEELTRHDFFLLLSEFEGLPLSLVEAMARGCVPVVAESPSGIPELVDDGDNGLIVSGRDYERWAAKLVELWGDGPSRSEMSRRARAKVRQRFTVEQVARQFDELFRRVATDVIGRVHRRPPALNWGPARTQTGDVLPPPNVHRPAALQIPGLQ